MTWSCSTRTDIIDEGLLEAMAAAGCRDIYYGIETGSAFNQQMIAKGLDLCRAREIVRYTAAVGIRPVTGFIVGHPTETEETLNDTLAAFFCHLRDGRHRAHLFVLCPFHQSPMFPEYEKTLDRVAEYPDLPLVEGLSSEITDLKRRERAVFASSYRYKTPQLASKLVDASESLSCHLVVLRSLLPRLLPHYRSPMEWYRRWVEWIETNNNVRRDGTPLMHQGSTRDVLRFVQEEVRRLSLEDSAVADLVRYEEMVLDAGDLSEPVCAESKGPALSEGSLLMARCHFVTGYFARDIGALLRDDDATLGHGVWVVVANTGRGRLYTVQCTAAAVLALESAKRPILVAALLSRLSCDHGPGGPGGFPLLADLLQRGLLCVVPS